MILTEEKQFIEKRIREQRKYILGLPTDTARQREVMASAIGQMEYLRGKRAEIEGLDQSYKRFLQQKL
jgi:hypothetical protein